MTELLHSAEELGEIGMWEHDLRTDMTAWSRGMYRILGLEPQTAELSREAILEPVHPGDRARIGALLRRVAQGPEGLAGEPPLLELRVVRPDGAVRDIRARGFLEHDADGRPIRWVGSVQDVTERRLVERSLSVHHGVSRALAEWGAFEEGAVDLLRRIGTALGCCVGTLWAWATGAAGLTCRAFWSESAVDAGEFEAMTRRLSFAPGSGMPGQAWEARAPILIEDLRADPRFGRWPAALRLGLSSGLAFPALDTSGPVAVMTFYSLDRRPANEWLNRTLAEVGHELGRFLAGRLTDLVPRRLTPRELEVLQLAAAGNSGPEIARQLVVSLRTVKTHFEHIYEKLGVGDRAGAVALGLRAGLIR